MGIHDKYGKMILRKAAGTAFAESGESVRVEFGNHGFAIIDGTVGKSIAVEIESRVSKQVRGALLDLVFHKYPKKLLVLLPVHMNNPTKTVNQCKLILRRFIIEKNFRVVLLDGHGNDEKYAIDTQIVKGALMELGFK